MLTKFDDSKRAVVNLMARENIVAQIVDGTETAKFNPVTRVLILPNWTGLSVEQCDLLMSHEVGHALFSDSKLDLSKVSTGLFSYLNIIEDARIERRMKGAFPGLAPTFYKGYRDFHANGPILKGTSDALINPKTGAAVPIASLKLIDRINLHYKIGAFCKVPFTAEERVWLSRIDRASSTEECLRIAKELHKQQKESNTPQPKNNPSSTPEQSKSPKSHDNDESEGQGDDQDGSDGDSAGDDSQDSDSDSADGDSGKSDDESDESDDESKSGQAGDEESDDSADGKGDS